MANEPAQTQEVATNTSAQNEKQINELYDQFQESYAQDQQDQNGVSGKTLELLKKYVDKLVTDRLEEFLTERSKDFLGEEISEGLNVNDPAIKSAIKQQINNMVIGRACASGSPGQCGIQKGADPIEMFSGQFLQEATDLVIGGAGMDFTFRRSYKSQVVYNGPLGAKWDHTYNLYIRQLGNNLLIRSSGELREDFYTKHPKFGEAGFDYWVPPDGRHGIIEEQENSFTWRSPGGVRFFYQQDAADLLFHRIQRIEDRFGNYLDFTYQDDLLQRVEINHPKRFVIFNYDTFRRIETMQDHTGRQWTYTYDDYGDLVGITSPATERYPAGLTTTYEYSSSEYSAPLQHNLIRITDPAGQLYLENEYGTDPGLLNFNRVIRQRQGNGEYFFEYETVVSEFEFDYNESEKPAIQVNQMMRNGHLVHSIYNKFGNLLFQEEYVQQEGIRRLVVWRYRYNRDGALVGVISPEGTVTQYYYGRDDYLKVNDIADEEVSTHDDLTASVRMAFGNLLAVVRRAKPYDLAQMNLNRGVWGDFFPEILGAFEADDVIVKNTYESDYQQILTVSDPRYTAQANPRNPEGVIYKQHLTKYEYSAMPRKTLRRIRYPDTTFPVSLSNGTASLIGISDEYLRYDARGRLEKMADPEGNVTENRYFPVGLAGIREGYLREVIRDVGNLNLVTSFDVNDVGIVTSIKNPLGIQTKDAVNELNQVIETTSGGPGYRTRSFFDKNGLLERQERDNLDDTGHPSPGGDEVKTYKYDEQNNLVRETIGGNDLTKHHVFRHRYDGSDKRIETILPMGNKIQYKYDERLFSCATIRGATSPIASTAKTLYDKDGRKIAVVDGRGNITRFVYDTFNRVVQVTDALGNVQQNEYDKLGNVIAARFFERKVDGSYQLLNRSKFVYDERGNRIREIGYLFSSPIPTADIGGNPDAEFALAQNQGSVTEVETLFFYDKNRRLFRVVNAKGQETTYGYDGMNRRTLVRDNAGNYTRTFYDENSNIIRIDRHELVRNPQTQRVIREDVFSTVNEYDDLDRRIATMDGLGNRTAFTYDSRNNLLSVTDPLGNVKRYTYDVFNRKTSEIVEMTRIGLGGGTRLPDIVTQFVYDDNDRLIALIDANGNETHFSYDELNRQFQTTYADGSYTRLSFDAEDNVITQRDNNGLQVQYQIDALNRRLRIDLDETGLNPQFPYPVGSESYEEYSYDGLGRVVSQENDFNKCTSKIDSFGRAYEEQLRFTTPTPKPTGTLTIARSFDILSNRTDITYTSGRKIHYEYDDLNRIQKISNVAKGKNYPGSKTFGAQYEIARYRYRGLRLARAIYGNRTGYRLAYDEAGRLISTRHVLRGNTRLDIQQLFDGAGNRRFQLDNPAMSTRPNGETYKYDSVYRLTKYERQGLVAFNPTQFEPSNAPLSKNDMNGQQAINAVIGSLTQNPADYTYKYDALGNREKERQPGQPVVTYVPNTLNQYESVDGTKFKYDLNGNLIDDGTLLYFYNYSNKLARVLKKGTKKELLGLAYDATGQLIIIREVGQTTYLINDGLNVIEEYAGSTVARQYVYENGIDRRCQIVSGGEEWWYHCDILISTRMLSNANGQILPNTRFEYDPFGAAIGPVTHNNPYLFAGKRLNRTIDQYDSRARQYSSLLGRFLQRDPKMNVDGPNLYLYCNDNPITFVDQLGMDKQTIANIRAWNRELWKSNLSRSSWSPSEREEFESEIGYTKALKEAQERYDVLARQIEEEKREKLMSLTLTATELAEAFIASSTPFGPLPGDFARYHLGPRPEHYIDEHTQVGVIPIGPKGPIEIESGVKPNVLLGIEHSGRIARESAEFFMEVKKEAYMVQAEVKAATAEAEVLGYAKVRGEFVKGQPVFKKVIQRPGPTYISPDIGSGKSQGGAHTGGVWKGGNTIRDLAKKETRLGNFNRELEKVAE